MLGTFSLGKKKRQMGLCAECWGVARSLCLICDATRLYGHILETPENQRRNDIIDLTGLPSSSSGSSEEEAWSDPAIEWLA